EASQLAVEIRRPHTEGVRDCQQPYRGDLFAAALDLRKVRRRQAGFACHLGQGPVDSLPAASEHRAEGFANQLRRFAVGEWHSSVAKSTGRLGGAPRV